MEDAAGRRKLLYGLLGELPDRSYPVAGRVIGTERCGDAIVERLLLDLNGIEEVPAIFMRPERVAGRTPVVLYNHAHGGDYALGKEELLRGRSALQQPPYGEVLVQEGYAALAIDAWTFGERRGRTESETFKEMLWKGQVLWGMMVFDSLQAIDYLTSRDDVDPARIATLGLSMGSTMAWWVAALDVRVKVCIDLCCLTDFQALMETRGLDGHGVYYYVPRLLTYFSTADINALIAPRPHLSLAGIYDRLTPEAGLRRIDAALQAIYTSTGQRKAWRLSTYPVGHLETAAMRAEVLAWLRRWL
ncbi:MAG: acetylxylan esterase [Chloroflexi bacterium]|nr:acetylxylan esterase [Chloroflexota bacterium]MCL5946436.1 acetylxylan esterase [Chloroflexota bacterium]